MATTTISLDPDAYDRLDKARRGDETFSDVIRRLVPKQVDFDAWMRSIQADPFSDEFIAAVEEQVEGRQSRSRRVE